MGRPSIDHQCGKGSMPDSPFHVLDQLVYVESKDRAGKCMEELEEDWSQSVSETVWTDLVQCICQSMEYEDLVALSGVISMVAGRGKRVSTGSGVLINIVQCKPLRRESCLSMADQGDMEQGSPGS